MVAACKPGLARSTNRINQGMAAFGALIKTHKQSFQQLHASEPSSHRKQSIYVCL